ncbi:MAG: hypothetical protein LGB78_07720 [Sulfurovum sp.]|nr:hypothetical protein [Sulfurovum sp.]MCB4764865.1 hypothetical protein [Sulfurovum sp.]MCB4781545.1 hypothetical protein [Sulfurovum sp.]
MASKNRWFMPTNTNNLRMIIAQGLISSPNGFKKYYADVLELFPGYIPLFRNRVQPDILSSVTSEVEGLTPCIVEFDLKKIEGFAKTISDSQLIDVQLEDIDKEKSDLLLLLAPIPLSCISKVIFKTTADKKAFEDDAELYSNVPINTLKLHYTKTDQKLFEAKPDITDYPIVKLKSMNFNTTNNIDYNKIYAFGGMLANLFYFAKNGTISNEVFLSCISGKKIGEYNDLSYIVDYFYNSEKSENDNHLYNSIVDVAIRSKDFKEEIIEFLESDSKTLNMANKLKSFEAISDKPVSEEFNEAKTLLGKVLLMLFHRENTEALIEYNLDIFTEKDYLTFAVIFGIRDKFIKVPKFLREFENLQNFISVKMANYTHKFLNSQIQFKELKRPSTIMEMLKNDRFKEYFAKELKIENCFQTIIPKLDYSVVKGKPVFFGIVMPKFEILEDEYFRFISKYKLTDYNKYLQKYEKIK